MSAMPCGCNELQWRRLVTRRHLLGGAGLAALGLHLPAARFAALAQEATPEEARGREVLVQGQHLSPIFNGSYVSPLVEIYGDVEIGHLLYRRNTSSTPVKASASTWVTRTTARTTPICWPADEPLVRRHGLDRPPGCHRELGRRRLHLLRLPLPHPQLRVRRGRHDHAQHDRELNRFVPLGCLR